MNIRIIFCASIMATAFAACSQMDEDQAAWQASEAAQAGLESNVEVRLSSGGFGIGISTRGSGSVESDNEGNFETPENEYIGIYMLATDRIGTNPEEARPVDWTDYRCIKMTNVQTKAVTEAGKTNLKWDNTYWYPYENWYAFRFYGYYPRVDDSNITLQSNLIVANYTGLDGTTDIIHGKSKGYCSDEDELSNNPANPDPWAKYRYSAQYFRKAGHLDECPSVDFGHKLMRVQFYIQGVGDENGSYEMANKMMLQSVAIKARNSVMGPGNWDGEHIPTKAYLVVADLENSGNTGTLTFDWENDCTESIVMRDNDNQPYDSKDKVNGNEEIKVGRPILLPVPDAGAGDGFIYGAQISLKMVDGEGNTLATFNDASPLDLNLKPEAGEYKAGHTYKVIIKISGPQQVSLKATLSDWEELNDDAFDDLDLN